MSRQHQSYYDTTETHLQSSFLLPYEQMYVQMFHNKKSHHSRATHQGAKPNISTILTQIQYVTSTMTFNHQTNPPKPVHFRPAHDTATNTGKTDTLRVILLHFPSLLQYSMYVNTLEHFKEFEGCI